MNKRSGGSKGPGKSSNTTYKDRGREKSPEKSPSKPFHAGRPGKGRRFVEEQPDKKAGFDDKKRHYSDRKEKPEGLKARPEKYSKPQKDYKKKVEAAPRPAKDWKLENHKSGEEATVDQLILKGRHEVIQALESGQTIDSVFISTGVKGPAGKIIRELASKKQIPVKEMNPDLFERKFGEKSQGIAAVCGAFTYASLEEITAKASGGNGILVALNHVEDARNLGAIVRTVEASGCDGVIIPKHRSAGMTEWAIRTAQGAASYLPVARVNNLGEALEKLKEDEFWVVGLDGDSDKTYDQVVYSGKMVLVAGGEDAGLGERVRKVCDDVVSIPLAGKTPSLNVSVSTAVVLYEMIRQKQFFKK